MAYTAPTIISSGTVFADMANGGASAHLERIVGAMLAPTPAPTTAPTLSATGGGTTGGALAAAEYYVVFTETNGVGETTASPESAVTIAAGNIPEITFPALQTGNTARNVYVGTASGAETLYATGITTPTFNLAALAPTNSYAVPPPKANSTGLTTAMPVAPSLATGAAPLFPPPSTVELNHRLSSMRRCEKGRLQTVWDEFAELYRRFSNGDPIAFPDALTKVRDAAVTFAALAQVANEFGALVDANPGHFATATTGIGGVQTRRVWP